MIKEEIEGRDRANRQKTDDVKIYSEMILDSSWNSSKRGITISKDGPPCHGVKERSFVTYHSRITTFLFSIIYNSSGKFFLWLSYHILPFLLATLSKTPFNDVSKTQHSFSSFCVQLMISKKMAFHLCETVLGCFTVDYYSTVLVDIILHLSLSK